MPRWDDELMSAVLWVIALCGAVWLVWFAPSPGHAGAGMLRDLPVTQGKELHTYQCLGYTTLGAMLGAKDRIVDGRAYNLQAFDTDADGAVDLVLVYGYVASRTLHPFPARYLVYVYGESTPRKQFVDLAGAGRCQDIVPVVSPHATSGQEYGGPQP